MKKLWRLNRVERGLLIQALLGVMAARIMLPVLPLSKVRRMLWRLLSAEQPLAAGRRCTAERVAWAVAAAEKHAPSGSTCLASALAGQALFRRHGYETHLRIGVKWGLGRTFAAHAWLERQDRIVLGGPASFVGQYQALPDVEHLIL